MSGDSQGWRTRPVASETPASGGSATDGSEFDPVEAYLGQLGEGSRRTMREALGKLADWASDGRETAHTLAWHRLRSPQTVALRRRLAQDLAPATANKHLAALRGVLRQCALKGWMSEADFRSASALPPARGPAPRERRQLGAPELARLAEVCRADPGPAGARDAALVAVLSDARLRRSEAVSLDVVDLDLGTGVVSVRVSSQSAPRRLLTHPETLRALERWLSIRGPEPGPLFNPINKGGRIEIRGLSEQAIYIACQKRAAAAGLSPISPEDLRRADPTRPDGHASKKGEEEPGDQPAPGTGPANTRRFESTTTDV